MLSETIVFVKVGGSFLTYKDKPFSVNYRALETVSDVLRIVYDKVKLVVGNGGGSFAHFVVKAYSASSVDSIVTLCQESTRKLNSILVDHLVKQGLRAVAIQTSAIMVDTEKGIQVFHTPVSQALSKGLIPVVYGECIFSERNGYRIVSTEEVFIELAKFIKPRRIVLLTNVDGIYDKNPHLHRDAKLITRIDRENIGIVLERLREQSSSDATGGIYGKLVFTAELSRELNVPVYVINGFDKESTINAILGCGEVRGSLIDLSH